MPQIVPTSFVSEEKEEKLYLNFCASCDVGDGDDVDEWDEGRGVYVLLHGLFHAVSPSSVCLYSGQIFMHYFRMTMTMNVGD